MKIQTVIAGVGATALLSTGAFLFPAAASPPTASHTLKFTDYTAKQANFNKTEFAEESIDRVAGKTIGFGMLYGKVDMKTHSAKGGATFVTSGGFLYATANFTSSPVTHAIITGGTGKFAGATGTLVATNLNKSGSRAAIVITYRH
jgi:hypothetical protein